MMDRTPEEQEKIGNLLTKLNMSMGVFVHGFDHWPVSTSLCSGNKEWRDKFLKYTRDAIDTSKRCTGKLITVVPGNYDRSIPMDYQTVHVLEALKPAAEILEPHQIVMVLEPLSDTPDLFLRHSSQAYVICKSVNSPSCKILFDIYHMQRNEGDLIPGIDRAYDEIAYYQIGDNPDEMNQEQAKSIIKISSNISTIKDTKECLAWSTEWLVREKKANWILSKLIGRQIIFKLSVL